MMRKENIGFPSLGGGEDQYLEEGKRYDYLNENTIYLDDEVHRNSQVKFCRQLRKLAEKELKKQPSNRKHIVIYISSYGGSVDDYFAMASEMIRVRNLDIIIETHCMGYAASAGAFLLMLGTPGYRYTTMYANILVHQTQLYGGSETYAEANRRLENVTKDWETLKDIMRNHTNMTEQDIKDLVDKNLDVTYSAEEAIKKGIVDKIRE